jgi:hypothetical protein
VVAAVPPWLGFGGHKRGHNVNSTGMRRSSDRPAGSGDWPGPTFGEDWPGPTFGEDWPGPTFDQRARA